jgi:prepilin-type processing-associated H-X9-DG protein
MILCQTNSFAQNFGNFFFGADYKNYKGLNVKFDFQKGGLFLETKVYRAKPEDSDDTTKLVSSIAKYKNHIFVVDSIYDFNDIQTNGKQKLFRLVDRLTKEKLYYVYEYSERGFHYLLSEYGKGGSDHYYESEIERSIDDFTGEIKINSPLISPVGIIYKYIKRGKSTYYLKFSIESNGIYHGKGVSVLFVDGSKWVRPNEKVDVDYNDGFDNNVFMLLTQSDLAIFREKVIKKIRLYIHDMEVDYSDGENFKNYISVVSGKK